MPKAENKTKPTNASVDEFVKAQPTLLRREECEALLALIGGVIGEKAVMWGEAIVGFGTYHYKGASGREGDWFLAGFSPRKHNLSIYVSGGFEGVNELLGALGKHKTSVGCLYVNKLDDIDMKVLRKIVVKAVARMQTLKA